MDFWERIGAGAGELIEAGGDIIEGVGLRARGTGAQTLANAAATQAQIDIAVMQAQNAETRKFQYLEILKWVVVGILLLASIIALKK